MKLKFAAIAAAAALLAAPAFAADLDVSVFNVATGAADTADYATAELALTGASLTAPPDGNFAVIVQDASNNTAYIEQTNGVLNFAVIVQTVSEANAAAIIQLGGDSSKAFIYQH